MTDALDPDDVVATFDSASELHAATVAALQHAPFPHLGNTEALARAIRVAGHLPWPILRELYTRIGGAEGIDPDTLDRVDMAAVAASFADEYGEGPFPAVLIGSSNGAMTHLGAAMGAPWLPGTLLVPVHRLGDADRPDLALEFGREMGPRLLKANPGIVLHQMHDSAQDQLMVARMTYFRTKWHELPDAYERFLTTHLADGAPVFVIDDSSSWPVVRVSDRHVFQSGGRGGLTPEEYLDRPNTPQPDDVAPEAEWGADPHFTDAVLAWCAAYGHPAVRVRYDGPQGPAAAVADTLRTWTRARGGTADRLIVPSFVVGDPWRTFATGRIPFWTYFPVEEALDSFESYLDDAEPYAGVDVTLFQHGTASPRLAGPADFERVVRAHGADYRLIAVDPEKSPRDIGSMAKYGPILGREPDAGIPWSPLAPDAAITGLESVIAQGV